MHDSMSPDAIRMRRNRRHRKGDHRDCSGWDRCESSFAASEVPLTVAVPPLPAVANAGERDEDDDGRQLGGIEQAVVAFVATLPYRPPDPRALLAQIAIRLAQRVDESGAMPAAIRELRTMVMQLTEIPDQPAGPLDVQRLRRAQSRLDSQLSRLV